MQSKLKETLVINMIIVVMLFIIGGYSVRDSISVETFIMQNEPIYKIDTEEKTVSLMINVYQGEEYVKEYLKLFEKENIKVTFFLGGSWIVKNTDTVKEIFDNGHEIGNHGYNHKMHTKLTSEQSKNEITRTNELIRQITGKDCVLFAPPSGDVNENVVKDASDCGCATIMWSSDTIDWRDQDVDKIYNRVKRNIKPGLLVLMHPTDATLKALPDIILLLKANGYIFKTVGEQLK